MVWRRTSRYLYSGMATCDNDMVTCDSDTVACDSDVMTCDSDAVTRLIGNEIK